MPPSSSHSTRPRSSLLRRQGLIRSPSLPSLRPVGRCIDGLIPAGVDGFAGYIVSSALIISFHYLFSVIFAVHAVFLCCEFVSRRRFRRIGELFVAYAVIALLVTPLLPHMRLLLQESHTLPFGPKPVAVSLAELLMPPVFIAVVFVAGLLVHFAGPPSTSGIVQLKVPAAVMMMALWSLGPLLFFAVSSLTPTQVFVDRYLSYSGLALVLLLTYAGYSIFGARTGAIWALMIVLLGSARRADPRGAARPRRSRIGAFYAGHS